MSPIDYPARRAMARQWMTLAEQQLNAHQWEPTPVERRIAAALAGATRCPAKERPPHPGESLGWRLLRLAHCAPAIRLAALAGGWALPDDGADEGDQGIGVPGPDTVVTLSTLLAAIYPTARAAEQWHEQINSLYSTAMAAGTAGTTMDATVAARMIAEEPGISDHLADLEQLWGGFVSVGVLLHVVATGDVDY